MYSPEETKQSRVEQAWYLSQIRPMRLRPDQEQLVKENKHNLDKNGKCVDNNYPPELEPMAGECAQEKAGDLNDTAWQAFEEYQNFQSKESEDLF